MSDLILYLNNYPLPAEVVTKWPELKEEISYDSQFNIPDGFTVEIDNHDPTRYDPKYPGSLLYGMKVMKIPVSIFDPDMNETIMKGIVKNISTDEGTGIMSIDCTSQLSALAENDVQIVETGITPAEMAYKILTAPVTLGSTTPIIDPSFIDKSSYRFCKNYQQYQRWTGNITIYKGGDNNKKCKDVLPEINKLGHMALFSHYDRIYFWQYTEDYTPSIIISSTIANSYKDYYSEDDAFKIKNSYSIAYFNGATVSTVTGKDMKSINDYGESVFSIPSNDVDSSTSADFTMGLDNVVGAKRLGIAVISRLCKPAFMCEFDLPYSYNMLKVGDVIGLNFGAFSGLNTPVRITYAEYNRDDNRIKIKTLFL